MISLEYTLEVLVNGPCFLRCNKPVAHDFMSSFYAFVLFIFLCTISIYSLHHASQTTMCLLLIFWKNEAIFECFLAFLPNSRLRLQNIQRCLCMCFTSTWKMAPSLWYTPWCCFCRSVTFLAHFNTSDTNFHAGSTAKPGSMNGSTWI